MSKYKKHSRSSSSNGLFAATIIIGSIVYPHLTKLEQIISYFVLALASTLLILALFRVYKFINRLRRVSYDLNDMTGIEFENYVASSLVSWGYTNVTLTEKYDLGIDIIADKDGVRWGIQVKRHRGLVGVEAIRQAVTALNYYGCDRAMVITNSLYTKSAEKLARHNHCRLLKIVY